MIDFSSLESVPNCDSVVPKLELNELKFVQNKNFLNPSELFELEKRDSEIEEIDFSSLESVPKCDSVVPKLELNEFNSVQNVEVTMPDTPKEISDILDKIKQKMEETKNSQPPSE